MELKMNDPLQHLLYQEHQADKKRLKASLSHGQVILTITLPTERLLGSIARIEAADSLPDKLRVIAAELEA